MREKIRRARSSNGGSGDHRAAVHVIDTRRHRRGDSDELVVRSRV